MQQFTQDSLGNYHSTVKPLQNIRFADEHQIVERGGVPR